MDSITISTVISTIAGAVAALVVAYSQRNKMRADAAATAATVAEKAVDSALQAQAAALTFYQNRSDNLANELVDQDMVVRKLQRRARDAEERLYKIEQQMQKEQESRLQLLTTLAIAVRYINILRLQLEQISETPLPWPRALEEWLRTYSPEEEIQRAEKEEDK